MKYMGSKRSMLTNGLGELLKAELPKCGRFVDLFCGGGSVSWFAAAESDRPVFSVDLQDYATALAAAVITRTELADSKTLASNWLEASIKAAHKSTEWKKAEKIGQGWINTATWCKRTRGLVDEFGDAVGIVTRSYGGHYFSLQQSLVLDAMLEFLPKEEGDRAVCLAATIICASQCAAAPGHTAQPFQPTRKAAKFLREAWKRDPQHYAGRALEMICGKHAKTAGSIQTGDAVEIAGNLNSTDLVFVDPPYSAVHYSRSPRVSLSQLSTFPTLDRTDSECYHPIKMRS